MATIKLHTNLLRAKKKSSFFVLASIESCSHNQKKTKALDADWSYSNPPGKDGRVSRPHTSLGMMMVAEHVKSSAADIQQMFTVRKRIHLVTAP